MERHFSMLADARFGCAGAAGQAGDRARRQRSLFSPGQSSCPPEVVFVHGPDYLIDSESYQRRYRRPDGQVLARGFYVVVWPHGPGACSYGEEAVFLGPYPDRSMAELRQAGLVAGGGTGLAGNHGQVHDA